MVIDHVAVLVEDGEQMADELRARYGLGSERGMFFARAGTRHWTVPLRPPACFEFMAIEDRDLAARTSDGARMLAVEAAGYGCVTWAVLVEDLEAVSKRLGIPIFDYTVEHGDGTRRGWRVVDGPPHLPFFIDYPNNGDRPARLQAMYDRVKHSCAPSGFGELTIRGSSAELREWLGPHELPLRFLAGRGGLAAVSLLTKDGNVTLA